MLTIKIIVILVVFRLSFPFFPGNLVHNFFKIKYKMQNDISKFPFLRVCLTLFALLDTFFFSKFYSVSVIM